MPSLLSIPKAAARKLVSAVRDVGDSRDRRAYRDSLGEPPALARRIIDSLERDGAVITTLEALSLPSTAAMMQSADVIVGDVKARVTPTDGSKKSYAMHATADQVEANPNLVGWGLEPLLLSVAAHYIGAAVAYRGLNFRRDLADGQKVETRLWHLDGEDRRILKVIVYLNDVTENHGPFEYAPKSKTPRGSPRISEGGRILDDDMARFVSESDCVTCTGKRGTAVIVDTCSVYHRGRVPKADRFTLFYAYNSKRPTHPEYCQPLFAREGFLSGNATLGATQRSALEYQY